MTFPHSRGLEPVAVALGPAAGQTGDQPVAFDLGAQGELGAGNAHRFGCVLDLPDDLFPLDGASIDLVSIEPRDQLQGEDGIGGGMTGDLFGIGHGGSSFSDDDEAPADEKQLALAAVSAATDAILVLVEFTRHDYDRFDGDPVENLADALKMVIQLQLARHDDHDRTGLELLGQLDHALWRFLDDWS